MSTGLSMFSCENTSQDPKWRGNSILSQAGIASYRCTEKAIPKLHSKLCVLAMASKKWLIVPWIYWLDHNVAGQPNSTSVVRVNSHVVGNLGANMSSAFSGHHRAFSCKCMRVTQYNNWAHEIQNFDSSSKASYNYKFLANEGTQVINWTTVSLGILVLKMKVCGK